MTYYESELKYLYGGGIQIEDLRLEEKEEADEKLRFEALQKLSEGFERVFDTLSDEEKAIVKGDLYEITTRIEDILEGC